MNQSSVYKKRTLTTLTLLAAILLGLVWLAGTSASARAQGTLLLGTSYKDATPKKVGPGGTVAYTVVLRNSDLVSTTSEIVVTDPLVANLSFVVGSAAVTPYPAGYSVPAPVGVKFIVNPIAPGGAVTLSFQATVATTVVPGDVITNTATITEGGVAFTRAVAVTIEDYPSAQINEPWNNQLFTTRGTFTIKGRAWNGEHPAFPEPPVLESISNNAGANDWYTVRWTTVPGAVAYILQESTDPYFVEIKQFSPVLSPTVQTLITAQPRGKTYYYRVKALKDVYESRWSAIQSVTVNATGLLVESLSEAPAEFIAPLAVTAVPTVEINIKKVGAITPDNWQRVTNMVLDSSGGWWNWQFPWTLPMEDNAQYTIQVRAKGPSGDWDPLKLDTITVNIRNGIRYVYLPLIMRRYPPVPYAPTLNIVSNDTYGNYQLGWTYSPTDDPYKPPSYTFQEATNSSFTSPTISQTVASTTLSWSFTNKTAGTYYYRVRGNNTYGAGPWSNVQTIVVNIRGFYDDFSNTASGWPRAVYWRGTQPVDGPVFDVNYENGSYRAKIMLNKDGWNNRRMGFVKAPYTNLYTKYDVEVNHRFAQAEDQVVPPDLGKAGLIFGANSTYSVVYVIEWNYEGSCAVSRYKNVTFPTTIFSFDNVSYLRGWGAGCYLNIGYDKHNLIKVSVSGNQATVYINGKSIGTFTDGDITNYHNVGLMSGSWDRTPVESRFDDFRVTAK